MPDIDYVPITTGEEGGVDFAAMTEAADPNADPAYAHVGTVIAGDDADFTALTVAAAAASFSTITTAGVAAQ